MLIEELTTLVHDNAVRIEKHEFSGTLRFEVHCQKGGIRRCVVIQEPEKLTYENYEKKINTENP